MRAAPFRPGGTASLAVVLAVALSGGIARGQSAPSAAENLSPGDIDSEHLFGFAEGSDLGVPGETELEWETTGRFGRRSGGFRAVDSSLALKMPITPDFRLAPGLTFNAYDVGTPGRTSGGLNGGFLETRLRLLDRRTATFGLTLSVVPGYGSVDSASGLPARSFGTDVALLADREIVPGRLVAALNASFGFASTLSDAAPPARGSGLEIAGALAYQVRPGLFLGGEARYARAYQGLVLGRLGGQAAYIGPTLYASLSPKAWVSATWSLQVAGREQGGPRDLDLTNFDRHQMRLRVGYNF
ncbi:hypothetical protein J2X36_000511 [Methylobacterium sp. BE186]|uniref:hypothetical protein n=1 Tax=Methylobacterium sp. BE186 TaxID=2817715 RepID=UPI0028619D64|nr:hypothetical protein [Methylobacterium sp. BE186]MDR7035775.1 hypothetical protein [Methylobacterium sp. BE186]